MITRWLPRSFPGKLWALAGAVGLALCAPLERAWADEPHGYVEPCTLANVQEAHLDCEACAVAHGDPPCSARFAQRGYEKRCQTHGDPAGLSEIWCIARPKSADGPEPLNDKTKKTLKVLLLGVLPASLGMLVCLWLISAPRARREAPEK